MVSGLLVVEDRHRWQYASQVAGQEDHCVRLAGTVQLGALFDVLARVSGAGVLGQAVVGVVSGALLVQHDVFQHGAKLDGVPNHRLVLLRQVDALGVAAAFDVEHSAFAPAVLVVADQEAARVGRQSGLAGAGETEEQGHVAVIAHVGGAVHRQYVFFRQQEVLHGEHGFLHFAGVLHACQQHFALGEVEDDHAFRVSAITLRYAFEMRGVDDLPGFFAFRVVVVRTHKQHAAKQVVPRGFGGHAYRLVVLWVGAHVHVRYKAVALFEVGFHALPQGIELVGRERAVDVAPSDGVFGAGFFDDEAVHRRTASAGPGLDYQCAGIGEITFTAANGQFYQFSGANVGVNANVAIGHLVTIGGGRFLR